MKNIIVALILVLTATSFAFAQNNEPVFEKQDDLVKATYYHDNGMIKEVGYFKDEKLHDQWIRYDNSGKISVVANYDNGIKEGKWYIVGEQTTKEITYRENKLIKVEEVEGTDLSFI
ncbi:MAG: nicotinic acid mononucleotide adenyltransferase [Lutimonas sp.]